MSPGLKARLRGRLKELDQDRQERDRARKVVHRTGGAIDDLVEEVQRARRRIQRRQAVIKELRSDLDELQPDDADAATVEEELDRLAGELDEQIAVRDRLLDRLDVLKDRLDEATDARRRAAREIEHDWDAIKRIRERKRRRRERRDRPSPHFTFDEFDCNDGTPIPKASEPAVEHWCKTIGEKVRDRFGSVHINSGFRHKAYNARIGGEPNSVHIYDYPGRNYRAAAVDFTCARGTPADWYAFTAGLADGRGRYSTFHHADTRNRIGWPDATWTG